MTAPVHEDHLLLPFLLRLLGLLNDAGNGVVRLGRRNEPFCPRKGNTCLEGLKLIIGPCLYQAILESLLTRGAIP